MESQSEELAGLHNDLSLLLREIRALRNDIDANTKATQILTEVVRNLISVQLQQANRSLQQ